MKCCVGTIICDMLEQDDVDAADEISGVMPAAICKITAEVTATE